MTLDSACEFWLEQVRVSDSLLHPAKKPSTEPEDVPTSWVPRVSWARLIPSLSALHTLCRSKPRAEIPTGVLTVRPVAFQHHPQHLRPATQPRTQTRNPSLSQLFTILDHSIQITETYQDSSQSQIHQQAHRHTHPHVDPLTIFLKRDSL